MLRTMGGVRRAAAGWGTETMAFMAFVLLLAATADPDVRITAVSGGRYDAAVAAFDSGRMAAVMDQLKVAATKRCGSQSARFGRHFFDTRVDTARNVMVIENFRQIFFCYDPATDPYKPVPADWTATPAETANATVFATRFLDRLDRGDAAGIAMMDPMIEMTSKDWANLRAGAIQSREPGDGTLTPLFVQWINNPDWAAYPGAYAYFRVLDDHPGIEGTCGGVLVQRVRENDYRISQYDVQYVSTALARQNAMTDAELDNLCAR